MSFDVLDRTATGIAALGASLKKVNDLVEERTAWFDVELGHLRGDLAEWQRRATNAESLASELAEQVAALTARAEASEYRESSAQSSLESLTERVLELFGAGSKAGQIVAEMQTEERARSEQG